MSPLGVAIVGCGLIGRKRAQALGQHRLLAAVDSVPAAAERLARGFAGCLATTDLRRALEVPGLDVVVVATSNDALAANSLAALESGKHLLVEKPAARSAAELRPVSEECSRRALVGKVGFNHRFHPALERAREIVDSGALGALLYVRGRYGHGGRPGYEREWRADARRSGGGELLDQGSHLIDLSRWFLGDFARVSGRVPTYYWPMAVEDNAFLMLETGSGQMAWLHTSWTEWKNLFCFELFGRAGKLQIDGLGGSYGTERLTWYRMLPEMGPPDTTCWEFPGADVSWEREFAHFAACVERGERPSGSLEDGMAVLTIVDHLYRENDRDYHP